MPHIVVTSLARLHETVETHGALHMVTLINADTPVARPETVTEGNHLFLGFNDIVSPMEGMIAPGRQHVEDLIDFAQRWDRKKPLVIHCFAGISRSTAAAYICALALNENADEFVVARRLREAAPSATPNIRLVTIGDEILQRDGRMIEAIEAIGRGSDAYEGTPFILPLSA